MKSPKDEHAAPVQSQQKPRERLRQDVHANFPLSREDDSSKERTKK